MQIGNSQKDLYQVLWLITRIICHNNPRTKWGLPTSKSLASMLTILQPMERAEFRANVKFSSLVYRVRFFLLMALSSIVSGHEWLMILLNNNKGNFNIRQQIIQNYEDFGQFSYHNRIPSFTLSYKFFPSKSRGSRCFKSASYAKCSFIQWENAICSSILTEWVVPSLEASDMPPMVWRFSFRDTACLKVVATSRFFRLR